MKIVRFLLRTFDRVLSPLLLTLIFWAIISGYQLPTVAKLDFSRFISWFQHTPPTIPYDALGAIYNGRSQTTNAALHGLAGHEGVDIAAGCGATIYSPISGTVTYNGRDGYNHVDSSGKTWPQSTMLVITGDEVEVELLHGDYAPAVGEKVSAGQVVGKENKHGWASGCHTHIVLRMNGRIVNYLTWLQEETSKRRLVKRGHDSSYALRLSHYRPQDGGTNCDHDCSVMASGDSTASWDNGKGRLYASACANRPDLGWVIGKGDQPGTRFVVSGVRFECRDTGGWIRCYDPGDTDLAIVNAHSEGLLLSVPEIVEEPVCWVDMRIDTPIAPYGTDTFDWYMDR